MMTCGIDMGNEQRVSRGLGSTGGHPSYPLPVIVNHTAIHVEPTYNAAS